MLAQGILERAQELGIEQRIGQFVGLHVSVGYP
jgi:hypothetical protein